MLKFIALALMAVGAVSAAGLRARSADNASYQQDYIKAFTTLYKSSSCSEMSSNSETVTPEKVKLHVYRANNVLTGDMSRIEEVFKAPYYDPRQETKILIHGWLQQDPIDLNNKLDQLYIVRGKKVNVISVDWHQYACMNNYEYTAEHYVQEIARLVSQLLQSVRSRGSPYIHMIGFDMGAHIAGVASKRSDNEKVDRITALSPAGLFFEQMTADHKLQKGDAKFIDVINTNQGGAGYGNNLGDVDFLPNNGRIQPLAENATDSVTKDVLSHYVSNAYYWESVEFGHRGFIGKKCEHYKDFQNGKCALNEAEIMGESNTMKVLGSVYLYVNSEPYYSKGIYGMYSYGL